MRLLQKFIQNDPIIEESKLLDDYRIILSSHNFDEVIKHLKDILDKSYDFQFLTSEARNLESTRKEVRDLIEVFAEMLGNKIEDICYEDGYVITKPTRFEDYCPYSTEDLVLYTKRLIIGDNPEVFFDGGYYRIIDEYPEETPYYTITCCQIERK